MNHDKRDETIHKTQGFPANFAFNDLIDFCHPQRIEENPHGHLKTNPVLA